MEHHVQEMGLGFAKVLRNSRSLANLKPMGFGILKYTQHYISYQNACF